MDGLKAQISAMDAEADALKARLEALRAAAGDGKVLWQKLEVSVKCLSKILSTSFLSNSDSTVRGFLSRKPTRKGVSRWRG